MLTNSMETQMVSSLGVSIGGRVSQPEPMEMLRSSLITEDEPTLESPEDGAAPEPSPIEATRPAAGEGASKCPFTGMVNDAMSATRLEWTDEARERMERIPDFVRPMVQRSIEDHAEARGLTRIDRAVLDAVRGEIGM
ncbi:MAG: hypothetical protein HKN17_05635 [Rhodothermales bacterium]|nr:hypothetical protein [Rhodothermales bacterium]